MSLKQRGPKKYLFLAPALFLLVIFVIYPVLASLLLSFNIEAIPGAKVLEDRPIGLENYYKVLTSDDFINWKGIEEGSFPMGAIIHNLLWIAIHLPLTVFLGILIATLLQYTKGNSIVRSFIFLGVVIPMVVGGLLITFSFDKDLGIVNIFLRIFGLGEYARSWTIYPETALFSLILGSVWLWTGFAVTLYSAGLSSLPKETIEAAIVDGATFTTVLRRIIVPLLRPVTLTVVAMTILFDLKIFDIVYAATQGGPGGASMVLALLMYAYFARLGDYAMSATVAVILTLVTLPVIALWIRSVSKEE